MSVDAKKQIQSIIRKLQLQGIKCELDSGHWKVYTKAGMVVTGSTPSDPRAVDNFRARLRQNGVTVDPTPNGKGPTKHHVRQKQVLALLKKTLEELGYPNTRGVLSEFVDHALKVGRRQGLKKWKTRDSGYSSLRMALLGNQGLSGWVMNLVEATIDDLHKAAEPEPEPEPEPVSILDEVPEKVEPDKPAIPIWVDVLAAILDPNVGRYAAIQMAYKVKEMEERE